MSNATRPTTSGDPGQGFAGPRYRPEHEAQYFGAGSLEEAAHGMFTVEPEIDIVHVIETVVPGFIVLFGLFSGFIKERLFIGEAAIATVVGIVFGDHAADIFSPRAWAANSQTQNITLEFTRIVLALSVFAVGVELPKAYVKRHWRSLLVILGPNMLFGWLICGLFIWGLVPGLDYLSSLVVSACLTPTDPILAASIVGKGKFAQERVPAHIRHLLQCESGCNDGAAFPFLYLALTMLLRTHHDVGDSIGYWILLTLLYQVLLGIVIGAVVGVIARKLLKFSKRHELIDKESMVAMEVALAILVCALTMLAGSDDLLAAFSCGTAFAWDDWFTDSIEESNFSSILDLLLNCTVFMYIGATMPFAAWHDPYTTLNPWRLAVLGICVLIARRLPALYLLHPLMPDIKTKREALFAGHFGPMGVGAIFIASFATKKLPTPTIPPETTLDYLSLSCLPIIYCIVLCSILVHGLTITLLFMGRTVTTRVTRTWTMASGLSTADSDVENGGWMSRVSNAGFDIEKGPSALKGLIGPAKDDAESDRIANTDEAPPSDALPTVTSNDTNGDQQPTSILADAEKEGESTEGDAGASGGVTFLEPKGDDVMHTEPGMNDRLSDLNAEPPDEDQEEDITRGTAGFAVTGEKGGREPSSSPSPSSSPPPESKADEDKAFNRTPTVGFEDVPQPLRGAEPSERETRLEMLLRRSENYWTSLLRAARLSDQKPASSKAEKIERDQARRRLEQEILRRDEWCRREKYYTQREDEQGNPIDGSSIRHPSNKKHRKTGVPRTPEPPHAKTVKGDSSKPVHDMYREGKHVVEEDKDGEVVRVLDDVPPDSFSDDLISFSNRLADFDLDPEHRRAIIDEMSYLLHHHSGHRSPQKKPQDEEHYDVQKPGHVQKDQFPPEGDAQQGGSEPGKEKTLISKINRALDAPKKSNDVPKTKN